LGGGEVSARRKRPHCMRKGGGKAEGEPLRRPSQISAAEGRYQKDTFREPEGNLRKPGGGRYLWRENVYLACDDWREAKGKGK